MSTDNGEMQYETEAVPFESVDGTQHTAFIHRQKKAGQGAYGAAMGVTIDPPIRVGYIKHIDHNFPVLYFLLYFVSYSWDINHVSARYYY